PPKQARKKPTGKELLIFGGLTAAAFLLLFLLPVEEMMPKLLAPQHTTVEQGLARWQNVLVLLVDMLVGVATQAFVIALLLAMTKRLPSEEFTENALAIGVAAVALYVVSFAPFGFILQYLVLAWLFALDIFHIPAYI